MLLREIFCNTTSYLRDANDIHNQEFNHLVFVAVCLELHENAASSRNICMGDEIFERQLWFERIQSVWLCFLELSGQLHCRSRHLFRKAVIKSAYDMAMVWMHCVGRVCLFLVDHRCRAHIWIMSTLVYLFADHLHMCFYRSVMLTCTMSICDRTCCPAALNTHVLFNLRPTERQSPGRGMLACHNRSGKALGITRLETLFTCYGQPSQYISTLCVALRRTWAECLILSYLYLTAQDCINNSHSTMLRTQNLN